MGDYSERQYRIFALRQALSLAAADVTMWPIWIFTADNAGLSLHMWAKLLDTCIRCQVHLYQDSIMFKSAQRVPECHLTKIPRLSSVIIIMQTDVRLSLIIYGSRNTIRDALLAFHTLYAKELQPNKTIFHTVSGKRRGGGSHHIKFRHLSTCWSESGSDWTVN